MGAATIGAAMGRGGVRRRAVALGWIWRRARRLQARKEALCLGGARTNLVEFGVGRKASLALGGSSRRVWGGGLAAVGGFRSAPAKRSGAGRRATGESGAM